jgi:hypothetical protein
MKQLILGVVLGCLVLVWARSGFDVVDIDTDLGRDLAELSNIWQGKVVWLGPRLSPGLHASSSYYYFLYPFLWLSQGNARGLFVGTLLISAIALGWFGYELMKQFGYKSILAIVVIGLSYWWDRTSFHPGNGFTFAPFAFAGLVSLYFNYPLFLSALLMGVGLAFHPTTVFVLPLLGYQWWIHKNRLKNIIGMVIGLALPSTPLIAFEVITRGYVIRNLLAHPNPVIHQTVHLTNMSTLAGFMNLPLTVFLIAWLIVGIRVRDQLKVWYWIITLLFPVLILLSGFSGIYLFAVAGACQFILVVQLLKEKRVGFAILIVWAIIGLTKVGSFVGTSSQPRPLQSIEEASVAAIDSGTITKNEPIGVIAAITPDTKVPAADDYRFLLRIAGYNVLDATMYKEVKKLVMFVESPGFDWENWNNWELSQFGDKRLIHHVNVNETEVLIFDK